MQTTAKLNIRLTPELTGKDVGDLPPGTPVDVLEAPSGTPEGWVPIRLWVARKYLTDETAPTAVPALESSPGPQSGPMEFEVRDHFLYQAGQRVSYRPSPNHGGEIEPSLIVIHYTGDNSLEGALSWLCAQKSQVSAHLVIAKDGTVYQLLPFNVCGWHAGASEYDGRSGVNSFSIGIENQGMGDTWPAAQVAANRAVIAALRDAYGITDVVGHEDVAVPTGRKADPGPNFPWDIVLGEGEEPEKLPEPQEDPGSPANELDLCRQYKNIIIAAAQDHQWAPEIIAGILSRESRFGLALAADGTGDGGHGHSLMQIDDRSFRDWLENNDWRDPATNIVMGVQILTDKYNYLATHGYLDSLSDADAQRAAIAAYNCGEGNMAKVLQAGEDIDSRTTGRDYSADVLARAEQFKEVFAV